MLKIKCFVLIILLWMCLGSDVYSQQLENKVKTFLYTGKVGNLEVRFTLVFNPAEPCTFLQGSYYYVSYRPEQLYLLTGSCVDHACHPTDYTNSIIKQGLKLKEYTNTKYTAWLSLCTKEVDSLNELIGTMVNTTGQGKSFNVTLKLLAVSK